MSADPALLERVVANLVDNAVNATDGNGATVAVEARTVSDGVHLRVVDHGRGIPVKDRERVFEPFQRVGKRRGDAGLGLGLTVARGFARAMGADLQVEDTPGGGTTMVLTLAGSTD